MTQVLISEMAKHLDWAGFEVCFEGESGVVAHDERHNIYRIYPIVDVTAFANAWAEVKCETSTDLMAAMELAM